MTLARPSGFRRLVTLVGVVAGLIEVLRRPATERSVRVAIERGGRAQAEGPTITFIPITHATVRGGLSVFGNRGG